MAFNFSCLIWSPKTFDIKYCWIGIIWWTIYFDSIRPSENVLFFINYITMVEVFVLFYKKLSWHNCLFHTSLATCTNVLSHTNATKRVTQMYCFSLNNGFHFIECMLWCRLVMYLMYRLKTFSDIFLLMQHGI